MNNKLKILIVGGGMYVSGRGVDNYGTILPAIFEFYRNYNTIELAIAVTSKYSYLKLKKNIFNLKNKTKLDINFNFFYKDGPLSYKNALNKFRPNVAIVAVPDHLHFKITSNLIKNGVNCLLVKPMTLTSSDATKLINLKNKYNVLGFVEFHKRFDIANKLIKDTFENNLIGEPLYSVIEYSQRKIMPSNIFKKWSNKTNIFNYLGVHYVDLIYWITGYLPIEVTAWGQKEYLKSISINTYDSTQTIIKWQKPKGNFFISTHLSNWIDPNNSSSMSDQKIKIIGTKGRIESDQKNRGLQIVSDSKGVEDINPYFNTNLYDIKNEILSFDGYGIQSIIKFLAINFKFNNQKKINLSKEITSLSTFEDGLISTKVIEAVDKSLRNKNKNIKI